MHSVLIFFTLFIVLLGSHFQARHLAKNVHPRTPLLMYVIALATPLIVMVIMLSTLCWYMLPGWDGHIWDDHSIVHLLSWTALALAAGGTAFSWGQSLIAWFMVRRYPRTTDSNLINTAQRLAAIFGISCPTVLVCDSTQPIALSGGVPGGKKYILLSSWMISNLDEEEKEAVLAHELAHIKRRDGIVIGLAHTLRNINFYIPALWSGWRVFRLRLELATDELTARITGRPLALASALLKASQQALYTRNKLSLMMTGNPLGSSFIDGNLSQRIKPLLEEPDEEDNKTSVTPSYTMFMGSMVLFQGGAVLLGHPLLCSCLPV